MIAPRYLFIRYMMPSCAPLRRRMSAPGDNPCLAAACEIPTRLLRHLGAQVNIMRTNRLEMEARLEDARQREHAAAVAAQTLRADLGPADPPSTAAQAEEKKVCCAFS